jgi:hypothetical protein
MSMWYLGVLPEYVKGNDVKKFLEKLHDHDEVKCPLGD